MAVNFNYNLTKIRDPKTGKFVPLPSMTGPKGDKGDKGEQGLPYDHSEEFTQLAEQVRNEAERITADREKIQKNSTDIILLKDETVKIKADIPIMEVTGSDITADQTHQGAAIIKELQGGTKQVTTHGYNLFDASKLRTKSVGGATVTNNGDGSFTVSGSGNLSETFVLNHTYSHEETLNLLKVGKVRLNQNGNTTPMALVQLMNNSGVIIQLTKDTPSVTITQEMLNIADCCLRIWIYDEVGAPIKTGTMRPMLYQDGDGTWEPFTGGVPSPSPDYPQEIKAIGFNEDKNHHVNVISHGSQLFDASKLPTKSAGGATVTNNGDGSFTISGSGNATNNISLFFDYTHEQTLKLLKSGNLTLQVEKVTNPYIVINLRNRDGQISYLISQNTNISSIDITSFINDPTCFLRIQFYCVIGDPIKTGTIKPMLYQDGDGTWGPFRFFEYNIHLDSPLYEGDRIYLEDGELWEYRENKSVIYDGSADENWTVQQYSNLCAYIAIKDAAYGKTFCNRFKQYDVISSRPDGTIGIAIEGVSINISGVFFGIKGIATNTITWKSYLEQNPIEVVYKLKQPTLKKLGSAEAFNLRTFDDRTYIEVVGSKELGTENIFIVPRNQSGGLITDAFATSKKNEINAVEQANLESRISALEKLAVKESV